jgi:hypothetical protein
MHVELENPLLADDLIAFLRRCGCSVVRLSPVVLDVDIHEGDAVREPDVLAAEVRAYVRAWATLHGLDPPEVESLSSGRARR